MPAPQLNIHCKSLFLTHQGDKVFKNPRRERVSVYGFFKCLLISRQFLRASQKYRIYELTIGKFYDSNKFRVTFSSCRGGICTEELQLTLEDIQRLNQILNVQYVDVFQYKDKHLNQYSAACKIFTGHIALCPHFAHSEDEAHNHEIIKQVQRQLYSLRCNIKTLIHLPKMFGLNLIYCGLGKVENFYQVKQVLSSHRIRKLTIANESRHSDPRFDETIADDYFVDFSVCPRIKKLDFRWNQFDENHEIVSKLTKMVSFFPNLTNIYCNIDAVLYASEQFSLQDLIIRMTRECRTIKHLQKACPPSASIRIIYSFKVRKLEPLKDVKQMLKHFLKTTGFNQLGLFKYDSEEIEDGDVLSVRYYYTVAVEWREPKLMCVLLIIGDLDSLTLDATEMNEKDGNLFIMSP